MQTTSERYADGMVSERVFVGLFSEDDPVMVALKVRKCAGSQPGQWTKDSEIRQVWRMEREKDKRRKTKDKRYESNDQISVGGSGRSVRDFE